MSAIRRNACARWLLLVVAVLAVGVGFVALFLHERASEAAALAPTAARPTAVAVEASCSDGGVATTRVRSADDVALGPLVLLGGRAWRTAKPDAFNRQGYKIPVTLPEDGRATLSVPTALRGRVALVYTLKAQDRVWGEGVRGGDVAVRFTACPSDGKPGRTGWAGGLVVDRPRCVTLVATPSTGKPVRRRVPLGRRC